MMGVASTAFPNPAKQLLAAHVLGSQHCLGSQARRSIGGFGAQVGFETAGCLFDRLPFVVLS